MVNRLHLRLLPLMGISAVRRMQPILDFSLGIYHTGYDGNTYGDGRDSKQTVR